MQRKSPAALFFVCIFIQAIDDSDDGVFPASCFSIGLVHTMRVVPLLCEQEYAVKIRIINSLYITVCLYIIFSCDELTTITFSVVQWKHNYTVVNLSVFVYRLFHEDCSSLIRTSL